MAYETPDPRHQPGKYINNAKHPHGQGSLSLSGQASLAVRSAVLIFCRCAFPADNAVALAGDAAAWMGRLICRHVGAAIHVRIYPETDSGHPAVPRHHEPPDKWKN